MNEKEKQHYSLDLSILRHEAINPLVSIGGFARRIQKTLEHTDDYLYQMYSLANGIPDEKIQVEMSSLMEKLKNSYESIRDSSRRIIEVNSGIEKVLEDIISGEEITHEIRPLRKKKFDMYNDVVKPVHKLVDEQIIERDIYFDPHASMKKGEAVLNADLFLCKMVYKNLIENALRFMPNSGRLTLGVCSIQDSNVSYFQFNIYNSGPVISYDIIEGLMKGERKVGDLTGHGYGLPLVRDIVSKHGGKMWIEPNRTEGVNIIFTLPKE